MAKKNTFFDVGIAAMTAVLVATLVKNHEMKKAKKVSSKNTKEDHSDSKTNDFADMVDEWS